MAAATRETRESQLRTEESTPKRGPSSTHLAAAETEGRGPATDSRADATIPATGPREAG